MPHRRSSLFYTRGSETEPIIWLVRHEAPIRSQFRRRKLLSFPYRNLRASKTTFFWKRFCISFSPVLFGLPEVFPRFLPPPPYRNIESRKTTRFFKKSSYYITEACTPQKTTSNFVFLKTFSTIWTTTLKGLKTTANCSFFKKSLYSLTATSSGVFSIPDSKRFLISLILLTATSEAEKRQRRENVFFKSSFHLPTT